MPIEPVITPKRRLSMMPLVDVIFLLLMFFMLSSTFSNFASLELDRTRDISKNKSENISNKNETKAVFVVIDGVGNVWVAGQKNTLPELVTTMNQFHLNGARAVFVVPRSGASVQNLVSVIERIRKSKIKVVTIAD